jgi:hypothetical protein
MVRFNRDVEAVSILVRCYKDHHVITITRGPNGDLRIRTNQ